MTGTDFLAAVLPALVVGVLMAYYGRIQRQRDAHIEQRAATRKRESLLALDLTMATAKLSYATAVALQRGHVNGEVEDGVEAYNSARAKYLAFLNEVASEQITR